MTSFKSFVLASLLAIMFACASAAAQSQAQMNQDACRKYEQADAEMNKVYQQVLGQYKSDAEFIVKLKAAQRLWLAFRNAHVESLYPKRDKRAAYGSTYSMCRCAALAEITTARTETLKRWVNGGEEGDVCSGSVRMKN